MVTNPTESISVICVICAICVGFWIWATYVGYWIRALCVGFGFERLSICLPPDACWRRITNRLQLDT
jgi:hypothetical protein